MTGLWSCCCGVTARGQWRATEAGQWMALEERYADSVFSNSDIDIYIV